jgi:DNA segregation ATPase FtsK/SpoIIIE, S-DNA-T family
MILRLRYRRGGLPVDLEVSLPPDTTTGELAGQLVALDPKPRRFGQAPDCIAVGSGPGQVVVDAGATILGSPIVSGTDVEVVRGHAPGAGAGLVPKVAELTVIGGPDTGRIFPLRRGTNTIGRDA